MAHTALDDVDQVIHTTKIAVLVRFKDLNEVWIPRSVCECGDEIAVWDTDIVVADWYIEREGLSS